MNKEDLTSLAVKMEVDFNIRWKDYCYKKEELKRKNDTITTTVARSGASYNLSSNYSEKIDIPDDKIIQFVLLMEAYQKCMSNKS